MPDTFSRRAFNTRLLMAAPSLPLMPNLAYGDTDHGGRFQLISTWAATLAAIAMSRKVMLDRGNLLDAVEAGIRLEEENPKNSSVGIGGTPNADGVVELDACIMDGIGHRAGAVAALQDILHPISVARRVMETTPHVMLVGGGARQFAIDQGFPVVELLTDDERQKWKRRQEEQATETSVRDESELILPHHDTIALVGVDEAGRLAGGCSTSGWGYKLPGRVGDSPIIGSGLYVDNESGAAGATGTGENVMRYCGSFMVVEAIRSGKSPQAACEEVIRRIAEKDPKSTDDLHINFIAVDKQGRVGAAGTDQGFGVALGDVTGSQTRDAVWIRG